MHFNQFLSFSGSPHPPLTLPHAPPSTTPLPRFLSFCRSFSPVHPPHRAEISPASPPSAGHPQPGDSGHLSLQRARTGLPPLSLSLRRRRAGEARHGGTPLLRLLPPRHPSRSRIRPHDGGGREGEETASSSGGGRPVRGASICAVRDGVSLLHQRELLYSLLTALLPAAMAPPQ